jgi:hypothetical protein
MSENQREQFALAVSNLRPVEFHHGDCAGADAEAHDIVRLFCPDTRIVVHPPESDFLRAYKAGDEMRDPFSYLIRDRNIVDFTDILYATPYTDYYQPRSGSWFTIRYAGVKQKPCTVFKR